MRAAQADLFLGGDRVDDLIVMRSRREAAHGLDNHRATDAVVPSFAEIILRPVHHREGRIGNHGRSRLDAHFANLRFRFRADVQKQAIALEHAVALLGGNHVSVANSGDGVDRAFGADDDPALVDKSLIEPAAEHLHGQEAARANASNHSAELVHMGIDHDARAVGSLSGEDGAHAVIADGRNVGLHGIDHDFSNGLLEAGRAGSVGERAQKLQRPVLRQQGEGREGGQGG